MFSEVFVCPKGSFGAPSLEGEGGAILSRVAVLSRGCHPQQGCCPQQGVPSLAGDGAILSRMLLPLAGCAILSKGRSVKGESMKEGAVNRGAMKGSTKEPPPCQSTSGWYASYWNTFLQNYFSNLEDNNKFPNFLVEVNENSITY